MSPIGWEYIPREGVEDARVVVKSFSHHQVQFGKVARSFHQIMGSLPIAFVIILAVLGMSAGQDTTTSNRQATTTQNTGTVTRWGTTP